MISKQKLGQLIKQRDYSLSDSDVNFEADKMFDVIINCKYDFSRYDKNLFTKQGKKRVVYSYPKMTCEDILCQYLKEQLDHTFKLKYANRNQIMKMFFNILPSVKDLNDFVIIRVDFKSFFDSVLTQHVYEKYIQESILKRDSKDLLQSYVQTFKFCYPGLCLSNSMIELISRDFDERIRAVLSQYGVIFYERYVDDIIVIMKKYISKTKFLEIFNDSINDVFGKSPVRLSMEQDKFSYIAKRDIKVNQKYIFSYLGYLFELEEKTITKNNKSKNELTFRYGISEKKRRKYSGIMENAIIQYTKDNNLELLRQRIKIYSSRVVIGKTPGNNSVSWVTKGITANYRELRYHKDELDPKTEDFLKHLYFKLLKQHGSSIPYFMKQSCAEPSIYNILSNMERNRSIVFQDDIGVSKNTVRRWLQRINPGYSGYGKNYYQIVADYIDAIKIE